jgi:hypothetical protein
MQISTIKKSNFWNPFSNPSNKTQVNILNKNFLDISLKQFGSAYPQSPRKCLNFEILAKIEGKEAKFFFENLLRPYKDFIQVKKIQNHLMLVYL